MTLDLANYPYWRKPIHLMSLPCLATRKKLQKNIGRWVNVSICSLVLVKAAVHFASGFGYMSNSPSPYTMSYNTPFDRLLWDVGHQAYPHKIWTGRRDRYAYYPQKGGLHPFPGPRKRIRILCSKVTQPPSVQLWYGSSRGRKKTKASQIVAVDCVMGDDGRHGIRSTYHGWWY